MVALGKKRFRTNCTTAARLPPCFRSGGGFFSFFPIIRSCNGRHNPTRSRARGATKGVARESRGPEKEDAELAGSLRKCTGARVVVKAAPPAAHKQAETAARPRQLADHIIARRDVRGEGGL